ncbi:unnamed protein product [Ectocarpus sp. 12 AP-2014]
MGSFFYPALSEKSLIAFVKEVVSPTEVGRAVKAIRLGRVDAKSFFWLMRGFTSTKATELLAKRGVRYAGPRPASHTSTYTGSPFFSSGRGITNLLSSVSANGRVGDRFVLCFSDGVDACAQMITGCLVATGGSGDFRTGSGYHDDNTYHLGGSSPPPCSAIIFGESCERAGRPGGERDGINGAGARVLTVLDWVGVYGECSESLLCAWVYRGEAQANQGGTAL